MYNYLLINLLSTYGFNSAVLFDCLIRGHRWEPDVFNCGQLLAYRTEIVASDRSFSLKFDVISVAMKHWTVENLKSAYGA